MEKNQALELINLFEKSSKKDENTLNSAKKEISKKYKLKIPTNIEVYTSLPDKLAQKYKKYLLTKPVRQLSGVSVVAVMSKPSKCPHGKCSFCPGGVNSHFGNMPQSYTGHEPATMRAMRANYDPYIQVFNRLEQYIVLGQMPQKIELIIMGGTFLHFDKKYKYEFITDCFKALNDFSFLFYKKSRKENISSFDFGKFKKFFLLPGSVEDESRSKKIREKILKLKKKSNLKKEHKRNESSQVKCVGFTIETRPDYAGVEQAKEMRDFGVTRVEIGVESIYDDILKKFKRGHTVNDSIKATRILRDFGFKINYHMMLGLSDAKKDILMFKELFSNEDFKPDMLKIYPCMVFAGTELYDEWKKGKYAPLDAAHAAQIICEIKKFIPQFTRIMRIQRDIPTKVVSAGVEMTNLRQLVDSMLQNKKIKCKCIRCREVKDKFPKNPKIVVREYAASKGKEFFISYEDKSEDLLLGFVRLRFPSQFNLTKEITNNSALIRELHVYGQAAEIGKSKTKDVQHKGIGKLLMQHAELIAKQNKKKKIIVISGVGVRDYYKKLGYGIEGSYMVKKIK